MSSSNSAGDRRLQNMMTHDTARGCRDATVSSRMIEVPPPAPLGVGQVSITPLATKFRGFNERPGRKNRSGGSRRNPLEASARGGSVVQARGSRSGARYGIVMDDSRGW